MFSSVHHPWPENTYHHVLNLGDTDHPVNIPRTIDQETADSWVRVLTAYQEVLSVRDDDIGLSTISEHEILTGDHPPISMKPYRYSPSQRSEAYARIKAFEANGWIEPAIGPWSFPVVIVPKKSGGIRICID